MTGPEQKDPKFDTVEMLAQAEGEGDGWDSFDAAEALIVGSRYALGEVSAVRALRRGSRRAPKLLIKCEKGLVMLKRLAPGRDDPAQVASSHAIQRVLAASGFPLPRLAHVRHGQATLVTYAGRTYELFEAVRGAPYDASLEQTQDAGRVLALFHTVLTAERLAREDAGPTFHRHPLIDATLKAAGERGQAPRETIEALRGAYSQAGHRADTAGFASWHPWIVHGDWHPGNMAFSGATVAAVFDYDTLRSAPRVLDLAMGCLQFSVVRGEGPDPRMWPEGVDESRLRRFTQGYDLFPGSMVSRGELEALPWLMVEALIAEPVLQIGARGKFGRLEADAALAMVERKARWLVANHERITRLAS